MSLLLNSLIGQSQQFDNFSMANYQEAYQRQINWILEQQHMFNTFQKAMMGASLNSGGFIEPKLPTKALSPEDRRVLEGELPF